MGADKAESGTDFRGFEIPNAILCDNGAPWSGNHGGHTPFEIRMMQMDVTPMHGRPQHPQTQGKIERFHRTLKEELLLRKPIAIWKKPKRSLTYSAIAAIITTGIAGGFLFTKRAAIAGGSFCEEDVWL